ncbi:MULTISPECIES: hypothetical protein [unclassified Duganella]|uniref:hypothetical protein n=1 Tax=unclassified Duganella TaxID=2636909 RepID=UPI0006F3C0A2|nr:MULTISPECIES: hypothetical protein [unclassified Duganella]KQV47572.1 hypothetical protein ASD07_11565 [Duganella sp. Root336D2]KRC00015.1 hypothetical protein ASE26_23570 [Duganella sp. Root198D2]
MARNFLIPALLMIAGATQAADFYGDGSCPSAVTTAQEAANKADWIMEATVYTIITFNGKLYPSDVTVEEAKMVAERDPKKIGKSLTLEISPCFAGGRKPFKARGKDQMEGKRYRFYGTRHAVSPLRRFFYMEPVEKQMPAIQDAISRLVTRPHENKGAKALADGWQHVRSTEGGFSVDLPGEVFDATKANGDAPGFILRSKDTFGSTFMAVFERSGRDAGMHRSYDQQMEKASPEQVVNFRGYPSVLSKGSLPGESTMATRSLFIRVPGGTYMLGVTMPQGAEGESLKSWERFTNSLVFN